jgi:hypothetical protein
MVPGGTVQGRWLPAEPGAVRDRLGDSRSGQDRGGQRESRLDQPPAPGRAQRAVRTRTADRERRRLPVLTCPWHWLTFGRARKPRATVTWSLAGGASPAASGVRTLRGSGRLSHYCGDHHARKVLSPPTMPEKSGQST